MTSGHLYILSQSPGGQTCNKRAVLRDRGGPSLANPSCGLCYPALTTRLSGLVIPYGTAPVTGAVLIFLFFR